MIPNKRTRQRGGIAIIVAIVVVVVIGVVLLLHFTSRRTPEGMQNFQQLVQKIDKLNNQIASREDRIGGLVRRYNETHPDEAIDTTGLGRFGMTPEQAEVLARRIAQEKDLSYRSLLQEVIDLTQEVTEISQEMQEIRGRLRPPYVIQKGETHFQVAMNFLSGEIGIEEEEALRLIEQEALFPELLPGFEIWNYWGEGVFGTFVTQGSAKISPNELMRRTKRKIDQERRTLTEARDRAQEEVADLEARRTELQQQVEKLDLERTDALKQLNQLSQENVELTGQLNSVVYRVGTFANFQKQGVLHKRALGKWRTAELENMTNTKSVDLRQTQEIIFLSGEAGLTKISKAILFPRYFTEGTDYRIEIAPDKKSGKIIFLKPERFQFAKIVVAVD
ncbi:hypothetical protein KKB28_04765 [bacterium]|nr:hypothetical protein [bacterium]